MVDSGEEEVADKHQGSCVHLGDSSDQPKVAQVGPSTCVVATMGGSMAAAELPTACHAGDGWYGFGGTTRRWWLCWLGAGVLGEARIAMATLCWPSMADMCSRAARASAVGLERERKEGARASKTSERGAVACIRASVRPRGVFLLCVVGHEHEVLQTMSSQYHRENTTENPNFPSSISQYGGSVITAQEEKL